MPQIGQPSAKVNETIRRQERLADNWTYRKYLQSNGDSVRSYNLSIAQTEVAASFPNMSYDYIAGPPHLYVTLNNPKPPKYESSDLKEWFLKKSYV